jgi:hypothetical protein
MYLTFRSSKSKLKREVNLQSFHYLVNTMSLSEMDGAQVKQG